MADLLLRRALRELIDDLFEHSRYTEEEAEEIVIENFYRWLAGNYKHHLKSDR